MCTTSLGYQPRVIHIDCKSTDFLVSGPSDDKWSIDLDVSCGAQHPPDYASDFDGTCFVLELPAGVLESAKGKGVAAVWKAFPGHGGRGLPSA